MYLITVIFLQSCLLFQSMKGIVFSEMVLMHRKRHYNDFIADKVINLTNGRLLTLWLKG